METVNETSDILQLVSFKLGDEEFGIDILVVQEIIRMISITKVPNSPYYVEGVINLRGKVIPVIDLRVRLGMEKIELKNSTRVIVIELEGRILGFIVDSVSEVLRISKNITEAPPDLIAGVDSKYIKSVGKLEDRLLILLNLEALTSS